MENYPVFKMLNDGLLQKRCTLTAGILVSLLGLGGIAGYVFDLPALRGDLVASIPVLPVYTAVSMVFLGLALVLFMVPAVRQHRYARRIFTIVVAVPWIISIYVLAGSLFAARFDIFHLLTSRSASLVSIPFLSAINLMLCTLGTTFLVFQPENNIGKTYGTGVPGLAVLYFNIFALVGYAQNIPTLTNVALSLPGLLGYTVIAASLLLHSFARGSLFYPLVSGSRQIRFFALIGLFIALLSIMDDIFGLIRVNNFIDTRNTDTPHALQLSYVGTTMVSVTLSTLLSVLTMRLMHYINFTQQTAQKIISTEKRFSATFEQAPVGVAHLDLQGRFVRVNPKLCNILGYSPKELLNLALWEVHLSDEGDMKEIKQCMYELMTGQNISCVHQSRYCRKDGTLVWINLTLSIVSSMQEEQPEYFILVMEDVTTKKQAELNLMESEARFRSIADVAPMIIWTSDKSAETTYINKTFQQFLQQPAESYLGFNWQNAMHPDDAPRVYMRYMTAFTNREPFSVEFRMRAANGKYFWFLGNGVPRYLENGEFVGFIGSCVDITDLRRAREAAEEASYRKDMFLSTVSHELRTPLNAIIGYSEMILKAETSDLSEKQKRYIRNIYVSGYQLLELINTVLDLSLVEAGKLPLSLETVDTRSFFDVLLKMVAEMAEQKGVSIQVDIQADLFAIIADPLRLRQIFFNLLTNAVKFNHQHGRVWIRLRQSEDRQWIVGEVEDTGIGIGADKIPQLFSAFYQVNASYARKYGGTGLGLALTKKLVELHGGDIQVYSQVDKGTRFTFRIPSKLSTYTSTRATLQNAGVASVAD